MSNVIKEKDYEKTLKDSRFIIFDKDANVLLENFEDIVMDIDDIDSDVKYFAKHANKCLNLNVADDDIREIFAKIEAGSLDLKKRFIYLAGYYNEFYVASWIGTIEHTDRIFDIWYDTNHDVYFTMNDCYMDCDTKYGIVDDIERYELKLNK